MKNERRRICLLDEIRGIAIVLMVFYHAFYVLGYEFGFSFMEVAQRFFEPVQPLFACLFIFISGISSNLSHSNFSRGAKLFLVALGFTAVTVLLLPKMGFENVQIRFGILHLLSVSMLLFALIRPLLEKIPLPVGLISFLLLFAVCYTLPTGQFLQFDVPQSLYLNGFTAALGFPPKSFSSADYFPLLPYFFIFVAGTFFGREAAAGRLPETWYRPHIPLLAAVGRKTLTIYVAHWPIIFLLGLIISKL